MVETITKIGSDVMKTTEKQGSTTSIEGQDQGTDKTTGLTAEKGQTVDPTEETPAKDTGTDTRTEVSPKKDADIKVEVSLKKDADIKIEASPEIDAEVNQQTDTSQEITVRTGMDAKTMIEDILVEAMIEEIGRSVEIEDRSTDKTRNIIEAIQETRVNMLIIGGKTGAERRDETVRDHSLETGALEEVKMVKAIETTALEGHQKETKTDAEIVQLMQPSNKEVIQQRK